MAAVGVGELALSNTNSDLKVGHAEHPVAVAADPPYEALLYYAKIQRAREDNNYQDDASAAVDGSDAEKYGSIDARVVPTLEGGEGLVVSEAERMQAQRALRSSTWVAMLYLITTDILGPQSAPWAFSQMGFGPGCALYVTFGVAAAAGGFALWYTYLKIDSDEYPTRNYSQLSERVLGKAFGGFVTGLMVLQMLVLCGISILQNGQGLAQASQYKLCFTVCILVWALLGMVTGQVQSLKNLSTIAHGTVWLNVTLMMMTMVGVAIYAPNYASALTANGAVMGPVVTHARVSSSFGPQLVGAMQAVTSFGGSLMFIEFCSEMRRPFDFWKAMVVSQTFITLVYLFYGCFIYGYQGQFTINPAYQSVSRYALQTAGNSISFVTSSVSFTLFANIGCKSLYLNVLQRFFNAPGLHTKLGRVLWGITIITWWAVAYAVGGGVPQLGDISGLLAAVAILQFTYSFPPMILLGHLMQVDAIELADEQWTPENPSARVDQWSNLSRWKRAFFGKRVAFKSLLVILALASLATAGLGTYASLESLIEAFDAAGSVYTSFGCTSPV